MRVLYGGTFDPIHEGHLAIARAVATELQSPVSMVPAADPPHREPPGASAGQRAAMLDLAVVGDGRLQVDRRELGRSGPSFTIDTLQEVRGEIGPDVSLVWVLGLDSLRQLDTWHHWRRIFGLAHVIGVERPGTSVLREWLRAQARVVHEELAPRWSTATALSGSPAGLYAPIPMRPLRDESATEIRRRIAEGQPWRDLVPVAVARFIDETGLYRPAPEP